VRLTKPLLIAIVILVSGSIANSQVNVLDSDPIAARKRLVYSQLGGYVGIGFNGQGGTFTTACNCEFNGGAGTGLAAGLMFERLTRSEFTWGIAAGYENRSINSRFREVEGVVQTSPGGKEYTVPLTFLNEANLNLSLFTATPYVKYEFLNFFYARLGVSLGYVFSSGLSHVKTLESSTVTFPNGETGSVNIPGSNDGSVLLEDGPVKDLRAFQLGLMFGVGKDIRLSKKVFLSPIIQYLLPITTIGANSTSFTVRSLQISVEVRHIL